MGCGCGWAMGLAWNQAMTLACRPRPRPRKAGKIFQGLPQVLCGLAGWQAWQGPTWWPGTDHEWLEQSSPPADRCLPGINLPAEQLVAFAFCVIA